jgi:hypothetical protein
LADLPRNAKQGHKATDKLADAFTTETAEKTGKSKRGVQSAKPSKEREGRFVAGATGCDNFDSIARRAHHVIAMASFTEQALRIRAGEADILAAMAGRG